ncbi:MAG: SGNH/GDSL hydrolase family protein [Candidatus Saccharimonadales bacterium]
MKRLVLFVITGMFLVLGVVLPTSTASAMGGNNRVGYVALGDSIAAGAGLSAAANATPEDLLCGRSPQSYPNIVAERLSKPLAAHIACGGATAGDLVSRQKLNDEVSMPAQIKTAFSQGKPELMTITAGANDLKWSTFVSKCLADTCGTATDDTVIAGYQRAMKYKLHAALMDIYVRSRGNPPQVVLTGYYNPFSTNCTLVNPAISAPEVTWIREKQEALNRTIENVTSYYNFATFAPVDFTGHDVCSPDSWIQGLTDRAPIHPTVRGQQAIADAILNEL